MRKIIFLMGLMITLALSAFTIAAEDTPLPVLRAAISDLESRVPGIGYPQTWQHTYVEVPTTDSSLGCAMVAGETMNRSVVAYQVTLGYDNASYQYMVAGDGSLVVPCDTQLIGGDLPSNADGDLAVGGPLRQPDIDVDNGDKATEDALCEVTAVRANIRLEPSEDAMIIGELVTDERAQVTSRTEGDEFWWELAAGGYVASWITTEIGEDCAEMAQITESDDDADADTDEPVTCGGRLESRMGVGDDGRVISGLPNNLRAAPGLEARLIGQIWHGRTFTVVDGPVCADGLIWYEVEHANSTGWTAEGASTQYWLRPLTVETDN